MMRCVICVDGTNVKSIWVVYIWHFSFTLVLHSEKLLCTLSFMQELELVMMHTDQLNALVEEGKRRTHDHVQGIEAKRRELMDEL